jgi:hypothetical protein
MARDVEFDVTGNDKTSAALRSAERNFARTNAKIKSEQEKTSKLLGSGLLGSIDKVAPKLAENLASSFAAAGKLGGPALAGGIALAAPLIGATISAAVIGGAGVGGVVGGVLLAARDPRVKEAGAAVGRNLLTGLERDAQVFVEPLLAQLDKVEQRFGQMRPTLQRIFRNSAQFLDPLVDGALDGVDGILRGLDRLIERGRPVMESFGRLFAETGDAVGDAMETISGGSEDAAKSVDSLTFAIGESIRTAGRFTRILTETYGFIHDAALETLSLGDANTGLGSALDRSADGARRLGSGTFGAADGIGAASAASADLQAALDGAAQAARDVTQAHADLYSQTTNVAEAMDRAKETIAENGRTLSLNSEKGRENRNALSVVAGALQRQYDAYVKVNGVSPRSAALADTLRGKFITLATSAGLSAGKAQELADKILNIPARRNTKITAPTAQARAEIKALQDKVNALRGKTIGVTVRVNASQLNKVNAQLARSGGGRGGLFNAAAYWAPADVGFGAARTGGPSQIDVASDVNVYLDGRPFYAVSVTAAQKVADRAAWRQKVGART